MRGSTQLRHMKHCTATGKNARSCSCAPTVRAALDGQFIRLGHLQHGWRKADLEPFDARLVEMRQRHEAGEQWQPKRTMRLHEYAAQWFTDLYSAADAGRISRLTFNSYEERWHNHLAPAFGALALAAIDASAIRRFVNAQLAKGLKPATVNSQITLLSGLLTDAVEAGYITANPCRQPRRARHGGSRRAQILAPAEHLAPKFLQLDEAKTLLAATPAEYRPMVLAALTTGARRGELLALQWEWIDFAKRRVWLGGQLQGRALVGAKCDSERHVVLYSGLAKLLGPRRQAEGFVFLSPRGEPWANQGAEREFMRAAYERAGLRRPGEMWHILRHTYASALAAHGVRRDVVEELMGHKRQGTTALYSHLFRDAYDGVEEALHAAFDGNVAATNGSVPKGTDVSPPVA